ncbi:MAG: primase [Parcubacteria group bacterium]|nr:primase [Parcubacteria group bacterium]
MAGSDTVEQIKGKLSILDVVTPYVKLAKNGKYWRGLSPFNKEKTPSFFVNVDRGSYYCFSTSQGGDMFTFVEKMEGVDFKGALKILADKAGVEIVYSGRGAEDKGKLERLREAMGKAEAVYVRNLTEASPAYEYALSRGLTPQAIHDWSIGVAPDSWRDLLEALGKDGFTQKELLDAGLIKEAEGKPGTWYDRFRNRLMFPIRDSAGRTVAFTGRALDPKDQAKYLNSPETELYKKHEVLFGMDKAKDAIRTRGFAILVEGQMDLLLLHQIGFTNTIALSGTALSKEHLALMKRYADNLMLALDSDRAGLAATAKNAIEALRAGMKVKAIRMPEGKDPADMAQEDPKAFTKLVADAQPIVEFFLSVLAGAGVDQHRLVLATERVVLPIVSAIQSPLEREHFVGIVARSLGSTPDAVRGSLSKVAREAQAPAGIPTRHSIASIPSEYLSAREHRASLLHALYVTYADSDLAKRLETEYNRINGAPFPETLPDERWLFEAGLAYGETPLGTAADDLLHAFETIVLTDKLAAATTRLRLAEASGDTDQIGNAMKECEDLSKRLSVLT